MLLDCIEQEGKWEDTFREVAGTQGDLDHVGDAKVVLQIIGILWGDLNGRMM